MKKKLEKIEVKIDEAMIKRFAKWTKKLKTANLMNDLKFRIIANNKLAIQEILRVILRDDKLIVIKTLGQKEISKSIYHGVILDCICQLGTGEIVNIEVQTSFNDNPFYRTRYNQSMLTIANAPKDKNFEYKNLKRNNKEYSTNLMLAPFRSRSFRFASCCIQ